MYFIQRNGVVFKYFENLDEAKKTKKNIKRADTTLYLEGVITHTPEMSLWEKGERGYPYEDARKIS